MIKNYFKIAGRFLSHNKVHSIINVLGLGIGISAFLVIFLIVQYDYSFDRWEPGAKHIYTLNARVGKNEFLGVPLPAADAIKNQITGMDAFYRYMDFKEIDFQVIVPGSAKSHDKVFNDEQGIVYADGSYFNLFPHDWLKGDPGVSLSHAGQVVLALSVARKYFPGLDLNEIMGKRILYGDSIHVFVSGIVSDLKEHTDFDNTAFISYQTFAYSRNGRNENFTQNWTFPWYGFHCFLKLSEKTSEKSVLMQLEKLYDAHMGNADPNFKFTAALHPLDELHFGLPTNGNPTNGKADRYVLRNLFLLGISLLLLAVINFVNLATAQSTARAKEIGVRKTLGSGKRQIVYQFLTETFVITLIATLFALCISPLIIKIFKGFVPDGLTDLGIFQPALIVFLIILIILVTILAGIYPAFVLTMFRPAQVLRGQTGLSAKPGSGRLRQVLTVSQFVLAQVFFIAVIVVGKQVHYELNKDIGIRRNAIVSFNTPFSGSMEDKKMPVLINELRAIPQIQNLSAYDGGEPFSNGYMQMSFSYYQKGKMIDKMLPVKDGDTNYIRVFDIPLVAGRNVRVDTSGKYAEVLINETMSREMGFESPDQAIGSFVSLGKDFHQTVVGVMRDFNMQSLHLPVEPLVYRGGQVVSGARVSLALNPLDLPSWQPALEKTSKIFKQIFPNLDLDYSFFDKKIEEVYKTDIRLSFLLRWATAIAIFIGCLGLLGLVSFMANKRTKEIGIRKVLGASVLQILVLLSRSLLKLILLGMLIGFPLAWYFSKKWLDDFAFKTTLDWWIFMGSGAAMTILGLLVLTLRTFRAARANPVLSLRND
jgi:putative ABC transport system permease protein